MLETQENLRIKHVTALVERIHKDCKKHEGPSCKKCEKCLRNDCEKCQAVDWLRNDIGLTSLLTKINIPKGGLQTYLLMI